MERVISLKFSARKFFFFFLLIWMQTSFALPFNIVPAAPLPTSVPQGGSVSASYTVTNNTEVTRYNNYVKYLPPNVVQNTTGGAGTCGVTFTLAAHASCTLRLNIYGEVNAKDPDAHHHLFVCFPGGTTCAGTNYPLDVTVAGLTSITVTPANATINLFSTQQYTATGHYADGSTAIITQSVVWSSTNIGVVTIDSNGLATAVGPSISIIIAMDPTTKISGSTLATVVDFILGVASGQYDRGDGHTPPLLVVSQGGFNWSQITSPLPIDGTFHTSTCWGNTTNGICLAAGRDETNSQPNQPPLLVKSLNQGVSWSIQTIFNGSLPTFGEYFSSSCTGPAGSALCIVAGQVEGPSGPLLVYSTDNAVTWTVDHTLAPVQPSATFSGASCTGSGSSAVCIAAGTDNTLGIPVIAFTNNGASSWSFSTIVFTNFAQLSACSCTPTSANSICIAVGRDFTTGMPLVLASTDTAQTFIQQTLNSPPANGNFVSSSCIGAGANAWCVAVGTNFTAPILYQTTNTGTTWNPVAIAGLPSQGQFFSVSCTGNNAPLCVAVGVDLAHSTPIVAASTDYGSTWALESAPTFPGLLNAVSCTGDGNAAMCFAGGENSVTLSAVLLKRIQGTWSADPTIASFTYPVSFLSNAGSSSNQFADLFQKEKITPRQLLEKIFTNKKALMHNLI